MGSNLSYKQRKIYQAAIIIWLILFVTVMSSIVMFDLQRAKMLFMENANLHYQRSNDRVHVIESVLEGFAVMVSVTNDPGREHIRGYAQKMLEQYPQIFMFEIVEKVFHNQIKSFTEYYRQNFYPDFEIKGFSHETDREWQTIKAAPYYMPVVFMEPFPAESRKIMGLDASSNRFFMQTLKGAEMLNHSASSDPFKLVEGNLAYIINRPISVPDMQEHSYTRKSGAVAEFAVLIVRADTFLDSEHHQLPGMRQLLYKASYDEADPNGHLQLQEAPAASWLESKIFP